MSYTDKVKRQEEKTLEKTETAVRQSTKPNSREGIIKNCTFVIFRNAPKKSHGTIEIPVAAGTRVLILREVDEMFYEVQLVEGQNGKTYYVDKQFCKPL